MHGGDRAQKPNGTSSRTGGAGAEWDEQPGGAEAEPAGASGRQDGSAAGAMR